MIAYMPIPLCHRIMKVAKERNLTFSQAVSFLIKKVEAPLFSRLEKVEAPIPRKPKLP